jgi:anti-sigma factor RsiW
VHGAAVGAAEGEVNGSGPPVAEEDLHAYVDGQLAPICRDAVQRYLQTNPEEARRVAGWTTQRDALRDAFAARATAPLPPSLNLSRLIEQRLRRRRVPWLAAASVLLALAVGGSGDWLLRGPTIPDHAAPAMAMLQQQALAAYAVYAVDKRHPIEVGADQKDHLSTWLSNRLRRTVKPPDLEALDYRLIGGRLLATEHGGAAALFMYEDSHGQRLSLVLRPMSPDLRAATSDMRQGSVNGCAWITNGLGYAVVAALPDAELDRVANFVRQAG